MIENLRWLASQTKKSHLLSKRPRDHETMKTKTLPWTLLFMCLYASQLYKYYLTL